MTLSFHLSTCFHPLKPKEDDYATCSEAYCTLRLYHQSEVPVSVSETLGIAPSSVQKIGDTYESSGQVRTTKLNGWFLTTKDSVASFDLQKHLNHLLDIVEPKSDELASLISKGWRADIACMWDSAYGHGGPAFSPSTCARLSRVGVEMWLDVYFHGAYDLLEREKTIWGGR